MYPCVTIFGGGGGGGGGWGGWVLRCAAWGAGLTGVGGCGALRLELGPSNRCHYYAAIGYALSHIV